MASLLKQMTQMNNMKIKFCDLNHNLVEKVGELGIESVCADYFNEVCRTKQPVMITASNPRWTFGGGVDFLFERNYPHLVGYKKMIGGENQRIGNICFCITVNNELKATKEQVKKAIEFAILNTYEGETLLLSGVGTGIGQMSESDFVEVLKEVYASN